jgi:hypothetical protein
VTSIQHTRLALGGLEADNLLAFLALLGLLRALDAFKPEWRARIAWRGMPMIAELHLDATVNVDEVVAVADAGLKGLARTYVFDRGDITYKPDEFRQFAAATGNDLSRAKLVAALGSDGAVKRDGDRIEATPLCAMFGQGHQHFLARLAELARRDHPNNAADISRAMFQQWQYEDETDGFRWDPIEDRRYAHQSGDPSDSRNKIGTVTGANRLAALGFAALTCAPTAAGLATVGVQGRRGEQDVFWPLPGVPTSYAGYLALLAHPDLGVEDRARAFGVYGVRAVAYSRRFQVGKFFNFERARVQML